MPRYEVYATRWDDAHIVEELIPARDLEFSMPLSDHGECSFTATVEPSRSLWRPALALPVSGVLIARDGVPVWQGWVTDERPAGSRSFTFTAHEWGAFFEGGSDNGIPAVPRTWSNVNDHQIFRDLISDAQAVAGQNVLIQLDQTTMGAAFSDRVVNWWDDTTVGREFKSVADAIGGPEWYFGSAGTLDNPVRQLILGDRLGHTVAETVLEFVEDTAPPERLRDIPMVALLGDLFPGPPPLVPTRRAGGNLIAQARTRSASTTATVTKATGSGEEAARLTAGSQADDLLDAGWPRITKTTAYPDVKVQATLQAHADADLNDAAGIATGYSLVALDGDPDWTQTPRGSTVRVVLDTDIYGGERPVGGPFGLDARLKSTVVRVPDAGPVQVEWQVATVLEMASGDSSPFNPPMPTVKRTWAGKPAPVPRTWKGN